MAKTALMVIDVLNTYDHEDADKLAKSAERVTPVIAELVERARAEDVDVIYVNDNHGDWHASAEKLVERAMAGGRPDLIEPVAPPEDAPFVMKLRHSIFFQTSLDYLLSQLEVDRLVLTGQVTEQCILYSGLDAYLRHHELVVPRDAVAHIWEHLAEAALEMMRQNMHAETPAADELRL